MLTALYEKQSCLISSTEGCLDFPRDRIAPTVAHQFCFQKDLNQSVSTSAHYVPCPACVKVNRRLVKCVSCMLELYGRESQPTVNRIKSEQDPFSFSLQVNA